MKILQVKDYTDGELLQIYHVVDDVELLEQALNEAREQLRIGVGGDGGELLEEYKHCGYDIEYYDTALEKYKCLVDEPVEEMIDIFI